MNTTAFIPSSKANELSTAFNWADSKEGWKYWAAKYNDLVITEERDEETLAGL